MASVIIQGNTFCLVHLIADVMVPQYLDTIPAIV